MRSSYLFGFAGLLGLAAFAGLLSADAEATNYSKSYDWDLVRTSSVYPADGSTGTVAALLLGKCEGGASCPAKGTSVAVTPTFAPIKCKMGADNLVFAVFAVDDDEWPTSWPSSVSCSYSAGGHTYTANIALHTDNTSQWDDVDTSAWVPGNGASFDFNPPSGAHATTKAAWRTYPLPTSPTYVSEVVSAVKGGTSWSGVRCLIVENGDVKFTDFLLVDVGENAPEGTGYCPVQRTGQSTVNVAVTVNRP